MHAQNWKAPFDDDVARAKDRHQQAIAEAQRACAEAKSELRRKHAAERREADPDAQYHRQVRELKSLDDALDADVRKADAAYHAKVARLGKEHGVTVR
jgi:flagellar motility protein MotE (MotC chaperone)